MAVLSAALNEALESIIEVALRHAIPPKSWSAAQCVLRAPSSECGHDAIVACCGAVRDPYDGLKFDDPRNDENVIDALFARDYIAGLVSSTSICSCVTSALGTLRPIRRWIRQCVMSCWRPSERIMRV